MGRAEPFKIGTRVHHRGAIHSVGENPQDAAGVLRGGWGVVQQSVKQSDGSYEYRVQVDRGIAGGGREPSSSTWWGSHHINRALPATQHKGDRD